MSIVECRIKDLNLLKGGVSHTDRLEYSPVMVIILCSEMRLFGNKMNLINMRSIKLLIRGDCYLT